MNIKIASTALLIIWVISIQSFAGTKSTEDRRYTEFHDLNEFEDLQEAFNQDKGKVRLVALLSASCGYCVKGYRYMRKILEEIPDERLRMYVVWEPMLSGDTRALSEKMSSKGTDSRMVYQAWDPDHITGKKWTAMMSKEKEEEWNEGATGPAWDVYFLYKGDAQWNKNQPTPPQFWQHQGAGIMDLALSYPQLKAKVEEFLAQLD